jgi:hypothetical protein
MNKNQNFTTVTRIAVALPFAIAGILNMASLTSRTLNLNPEEVSKCAFLFAIPWGWLIDYFGMAQFQHRWLWYAYGYAVLLWIPATLYASCIWVLLRAVKFISRSNDSNRKISQ